MFFGGRSSDSSCATLSSLACVQYPVAAWKRLDMHASMLTNLDSCSGAVGGFTPETRTTERVVKRHWVLLGGVFPAAPPARNT